jgi:integrase
VTDPEYKNVYELASPTVQVAMDLAVLTALRRGDILSLTRDNLTDEGILIHTSKTKKDLLIEWSNELRAVVDRAKRLPPQVRKPIIATRQGKAYTGQGFAAIWQRLMRKAVKKGIERYQFRDLRAKSASDDTLEAATQRLGHADPRITETVYRRKPRRVRPLR